jgi:hypothetical protein
MMPSQTPIFDRLVAEFAENDKHYIDLVGGIKPVIGEPVPVVKPAAPLEKNVGDETQRIDPILTFDAPVQLPRIIDTSATSSRDPEKKSGVFPRRKKDEKDDTASQTESSTSPDDSA